MGDKATNASAYTVDMVAMAAQTFRYYYNPFDYRLIRMALYTLHTIVANTYSGMYTNHMSNQRPHSIHQYVNHCVSRREREKGKTQKVMSLTGKEITNGQLLVDMETYSGDCVIVVVDGKRGSAPAVVV